MELMDRLKREGTPLLEGSKATFYWVGPEPVWVSADFNGWSAGFELAEVGENLWAWSVDLPPDAYVEYIFHRGDQRLKDPFNRRTVPNGLGKHNHYFYMPMGKAPLAAERRARPLAGALKTIELDTGGFLATHKRRVTLYAPACEEAVPLVVVYDGSDYLRLARLASLAEYLVAEGKMRPVAFAFLDHGGQARTLEYACAEASLNFILERVLPYAYSEINLLAGDAARGAFGVIGASMGGLMALYTGLRLPHLFGKVLAQSGAYTLEGYDYVVWELARHLDPQLLRIWLDAGNFEYLLDCNQEMFALLRERGFSAGFGEYTGGHNYTVWRNDLPAGLEFLFGAQERR